MGFIGSIKDLGEANFILEMTITQDCQNGKLCKFHGRSKRIYVRHPFIKGGGWKQYHEGWTSDVVAVTLDYLDCIR